MSGVQIPISAQFDASDIDKVLSELTQEVNRLGTTVADVNKVKFNPIDRATMTDLRRVQAQFDSLLKISGDFKKRMKDTGQAGADFFKLDFAKMYPDPNSRARQMRKAYDYVTAGTGAGFTAFAPPPAPPAPPAPPGGGNGGSGGGGGGFGGGAGPGGGGSGGGNGTPAPTWASAGRKILGSGLRSMGGAGGAAASAMDGAAAGLTGPMIIADLVAKGVSAVAGMVKQKIGSAQQLDIGYDTLKRQLGDVGVGFHELKASLENASWGFSATYEETQKVAAAFSHAAGSFGKDAKTLAEEVAVAGGFARSFGVSPELSAQFFGTMRANGVTSDENGSKKLALMIGETVAQSGSSAKMDDVLEAIASFTQQQTRFGMAAANTAGYLSEFAGLTGSHTPGTDPQAVAALLSSVNSAIQHGGNAGEAGQNFVYRALGSRNGLDPIQTQILQEQGLAGTMGGTFGAGSDWETFARKYRNVRSPSLGANSGQMNFSSIMDSLKQNYASNPELMLSAMSRLFGVSVSQAMKLAVVDPASVNGTTSRLSRLKLDLSKVNATGIERLTHIEADKSLSSDEKDRQFKAVYDKNQEKTQGTEIRDGLTGVQKVITDMAEKMVPLTTSIMNSVVYMAGGGVRSQRQIAEANVDAEHADRQAQINAGTKARSEAAQKEWVARSGNLLKEARQYAGTDRGSAAQKEYNRLKALVDGQGADDQSVQENTLESQRWAAERGKVGSGAGTAGTQSLQNADWFKAAAAETDRLDKLPPGTTMAQLYQESKFDPSATSDAGAMGLPQVMPDTLKSLEKRFGRRLNPYDAHDGVLIHRELMRENMAKFGNLPDALSAYNKGWDRSKWNNAETRAYAPAIMRRTSEFADQGATSKPSVSAAPVPKDADTKAAEAASKSASNSGAKAGDNRKQWFAFEHNIQLTLPSGQSAGSLSTVSTAAPSGNPYGTN